MSKVVYRPLGEIGHSRQGFRLDLPASAEIVKVDIRPVYGWFRKVKHLELDVFAVFHDGDTMQRRMIQIMDVGNTTAGNPFIAGPKAKWLGRFDLLGQKPTDFFHNHLDVWELEERQELEPPDLELEAA